MLRAARPKVFGQSSHSCRLVLPRLVRCRAPSMGYPRPTLHIAQLGLAGRRPSGATWRPQSYRFHIAFDRFRVWGRFGHTSGLGAMGGGVGQVRRLHGRGRGLHYLGCAHACGGEHALPCMRARTCARTRVCMCVCMYMYYE